MTTTPSTPDILTPEQAADYLQINRETIYRYIRDGKLLAGRLRRGHRIPKRNLDLLAQSNRTRPDISLREYHEDEIAEFMRRDELDEDARAIVRLVDQVAERGPF